MGIDAGINDPNQFYTGAANANKLLQNFATRRAGVQLSQGDQSGAVSTLQSSGQIDEANALQEHQQAIVEHARAYQTKMIGDIATSLNNVGQQQGWDQVLPAFDKLTPVFKQQGATDDQIKALRDAIAPDPKTFVQSVSANASKQLEQYTLEPGAKRYDGNGRLIAEGGPRYQALGENQSLVQTDAGQVGQGAGPSGGPPMGPDGGTLALPTGGIDEAASDPNAVRMVESGGRTDLVSGKGAEGSMQTMPSTLAKPGFGVRPAQPGPDGKISPEEMDRVGRDTLAAYSQHFHSPVLGLVAYNWGPGKTERWIANGAQIQKLPPDVKNYMASVMIAHARGLPLPPPPGHHGEDDLTFQNRQPYAAPSGGPQVVIQGKPAWRPLTDYEKSQYPNADGMTKNGPHYPPAAAMQSQQLPTDDEMKVHAQTYLLTGQMPPLGMNNTAARNKIISMSAQIATQHGWSGADVANLRAQYKSDSAALTKLQTQRAQIGAYEDTVKGSMGIVEENKGALANTGFASANKAVNWWQRETNDPNMAQLDNAINTVVNEYAKVISNATGGGVTSDQARNRAEELVNAADSPQSLHAKLDILRREMDIRVHSMDKASALLNGHIHSMLDDPHHATAVAKAVAKPKSGVYVPGKGVVWQ